ncbi:ribosome recycling factor [Leuconostocaceae bacterium ESL0958]|nr:ribosome recycling factor [Leuconostocaceae bacterium ESL0958]
MAFDFTQIKERMNGAQSALRRELSEIRTGRANPNLLNRVQVEYYGAMVPLNQVASISVPEARLLMVTPFDKNALDAIVQGINMADLGLNPSSDGNVVRLAIPQMTEEGRKDLVKDVKAAAEQAKVAVRNVRRDAMDGIKKADDMNEDEVHAAEEQAQKLTDENTKAIDEIAADKEKELLTI